MDELLKLLFPSTNEGNENQDLLQMIVHNHFNGSEPICRAWLETNVFGINWDVFFATCNSQAKQVFVNLKTKSEIPPEIQEQIYSLALREACARQLQTILTSKNVALTTEKEIASPFALGSRFNQVSTSCISRFVQHDGLPCGQTHFLANVMGWEPLCTLDAERAERCGVFGDGIFLELTLELHKYKFPALLSLCELLCCLPREINFKTNLKLSEVSKMKLIRLCGISKPVVWDQGSGAGWLFSRTVSTECRVEKEVFSSNSLLLLTNFCKIIVPDKTVMWMVFVNF